MSQEYTFSMIKPDATKRNLIGKINSYLEQEGLKIVAQKMVVLSREQAEAFYHEHRSKGFFNSLIQYIISGPVVLQVLRGENAILKNREVMGATNPQDAQPGTIRKDFAESIEANSIHGSDNLNSAQREISLFFSPAEIVG
ncbi:nucleoside-diphosphate kinase [Candidatus Tisiphia endosymbiont of Nemotelus uliginosus]|uniref:nucleoside-diphosphate kinase n=1 Tax=Candidatus Tisiphia endosymbiont of Nemotelus uliginosus TaxID=3077926 RepID=UPI0035C88817